MSPVELTEIIPSNITIVISNIIFWTMGVLITIERNGYNIYITKYRDMVANYFNGTQTILNNNDNDHEYYNDISFQFDTSVIML